MKTLLLQFVETLDRTMRGNRNLPRMESEVYNLTISQVQYLDAIAGLEKATVTGISERMGVTKPSATAAVQKLIRQGYVARIQSGQDRRVFYLELTIQGKAIALAKKKAAGEYEKFIRGALSPAELAEFEFTLHKLVTHFNQYHNQEKTT